MIKIKCPCGKMIKIFPYQKSRKKYCSKNCFYRFRERPSGLKYIIKVKNKAWFKYKGGHINKKGYRVIKSAGKIRVEHRVIMEKFLKRKLKRGEIVHHKDGNKLNNKISNLVIMTKEEHDKLHNGRGVKNL